MSLACEVPSKLASLTLRMKGRDYTQSRGGELVKVTQIISHFSYSLLEVTLVGGVRAQWS